MRRFHFSLEVLLQLRRRKEEEAKRKLARKNQEVTVAVQDLRRLHDTLQDLQRSQQEKRKHTVDIMDLRYAVAYRYSLKNDILKAGKRIDVLRAESEGIRKDLVRARQKTRTVELLRERRFAEWRKEYGAQEQGRTDEISQQKYARAATATS